MCMWVYGYMHKCCFVYYYIHVQRITLFLRQYFNIFAPPIARNYTCSLVRNKTVEFTLMSCKEYKIIYYFTQHNPYCVHASTGKIFVCHSIAITP